MPVKKSMRVKKPASSSKKATMPAAAPAPAGKTPVRWLRTFGAETIFIALMCVMAAAMLFAAAHSSSDTPERARVAVEPDAVLSQPEPAKVAASGVSTAEPSEPESVGTTARMTTVSGCLERSDESFRLKDTSGADAPRTRSWKSGFLRKSAASIDIVDATHRLRLSNHIGQRVSVTGTLEDRSLQARSLQRIAGSCK